MVQRSVQQTYAIRKQEKQEQQGKNDVQEAQNKIANSEIEKNKLQRVSQLVEKTRQASREDMRRGRNNAQGAIRMDADLSEDSLNDKIAKLKEQKNQTVNEEEKLAIQIQIDSTRTILTRFLIKRSYDDEDRRKEVLRADGQPYGDFEETDELDVDDLDANELERMAGRAATENRDDDDDDSSSSGSSNRTRDYENVKFEEESDEDELWETNLSQSREETNLEDIGIPTGVLDKSEEVASVEIEDNAYSGESLNQLEAQDEDKGHNNELSDEEKFLMGDASDYAQSLVTSNTEDPNLQDIEPPNSEGEDEERKERMRELLTNAQSENQNIGEIFEEATEK
jgi:hypothetical protein